MRSEKRVSKKSRFHEMVETNKIDKYDSFFWDTMFDENLDRFHGGAASRWWWMQMRSTYIQVKSGDVPSIGSSRST